MDDHRTIDADGGRDSGPLSSSLDHFESSVDLLEIQSASQYRIHARHADVRRRVIDALLQLPERRFWRQAHRMASCCASVKIIARGKSKPILVPARCRHRLCPACSHRRSWSCGQAIEALVKEMDAPRFITLTLSTENLTLEDALSKLRTGWKRLRQTEFWKRHVRGGVYSLEVTRGKTGDRWHPHLHVIADGSYMPQRELSATWEQATGDSCIVDIRAIHSRRQASRYISKYVSKGESMNSWTADEISEYAVAMCGQRVTQTFGCLHGRPADPKPDREDPPDPWTCVYWHQLAGYAREGWAPAVRVIEVSPRIGYLWRVLCGREDDRDPQLRVQPIGPELRELNNDLECCRVRAVWERNHPGQSYVEREPPGAAGARRARARAPTLFGDDHPDEPRWKI